MCLFLYDSCTYFSTKDPGNAPDKGRITATPWRLLLLILPGFLCVYGDALLLLKFYLRVKFEVVEAETVKISVSGNMTPCGLMDSFP
jgi:hypothetical protein